MHTTLRTLPLAVLLGCSVASVNEGATADQAAVAADAPAALGSCFLRDAGAGNFDVVCKAASLDPTAPFWARSVQVADAPLTNKDLEPGGETVLLQGVGPDRFPLTVRVLVATRSEIAGASAHVTRDLTVAIGAAEAAVTEPWGFITINVKSSLPVVVCNFDAYEIAMPGWAPFTGGAVTATKVGGYTLPTRTLEKRLPAPVTGVPAKCKAGPSTWEATLVEGSYTVTAENGITRD